MIVMHSMGTTQITVLPSGSMTIPLDPAAPSAETAIFLALLEAVTALPAPTLRGLCEEITQAEAQCCPEHRDMVRLHKMVAHAFLEIVEESDRISSEREASS